MQEKLAWKVRVLTTQLFPSPKTNVVLANIMIVHVSVTDLYLMYIHNLPLNSYPKGFIKLYEVHELQVLMHMLASLTGRFGDGYTLMLHQHGLSLNHFSVADIFLSHFPGSVIKVRNRIKVGF